MAGGTVVAGGVGTIVYVLAAVIAHPTIDTDAVVATMCVVAGAAILAQVRHHLALVHILCAELTCGIE